MYDAFLDHDYTTQKRTRVKQDSDAANSEEKPVATDKRRRKTPAKRGRGEGNANDAGASAKRKRSVKIEQGSSDLSSLSGEE
jgi:hypothetical protein